MVVHGAEEAPITPSCRTDSQPAEGDHAAVMSERGRRAHDAIFDAVEFGGGHTDRAHRMQDFEGAHSSHSVWSSAIVERG